MPSHRQLVVQVIPSTRAMGNSDTAAAQICYPASPIHSGEMTDLSVRNFFQEQVIIGEISDNGHTFGTFNRDYVDAPDMDQVVAEAAAAGVILSSPYAPNLASPPDGADDWANQPTTPQELYPGNGTGGGAPFVGQALASPKATSKVISGQTIGSLRKGTSTPGSAPNS